MSDIEYQILRYPDERLFPYGIHAVRPGERYPNGKIVGVAHTMLGARFSCWRRSRFDRRNPLAPSTPVRVK